MTDLPPSEFSPPKLLMIRPMLGEKVDKLFGAWGTTGELFKPYIIFNALNVDARTIVAGAAENAGGQP